MSVTRARIEELYREILGDESEEDPVRWRRRMRILRVATELFLERGYRQTSVSEIARRAGVAKGTVYLYFPTKGALLTSAVTLEERALIDRLSPLFEGRVPEHRRLHFMLRVTLEGVLELPLLGRLMANDAELGAALADLDPDVAARGFQLGEEWLAELIELAAPGTFSEEERNARARVIGHARYFTGLMTADPFIEDLDLERVATTFADMLVYGAIHRPPEEA